MSFSLVNFFNTTLSAASSNTATTFTVSSSANLPTLASGEVLPIILNDAATRKIFEICYVTGISGNILTVERAQEGTSAQNWNVGDFIWNGPTAGTALLQNTVDDFTTSGLITANGGITVPSGEAVTTPAIAGNPSFSAGLTVPSGETAIIDGTLTIPNATSNNQPVALGQFVGPGTTGGHITSLATSTTYTQTLSFTAPSAGYVWGQVRTAFTGESASSIDVALLINGTAYGSDSTLLPMTEAGVTSVTAGEAVTVEAQMTIGSTSPGIGASLYVDAIFIPSSSNI